MKAVTLEEARERVGDGVVYRAHPHGIAEDGVVTGASDDYVFVRYEHQHPSAAGIATRPADLEWAS